MSDKSLEGAGKPNEGFAKPGTTLEGRVANLFRLMGYNVTRNYFVEDHEIDVYAEKGAERIIVECKEYYGNLIDRDLILIFNTKVRDIMPNEAWFVTIRDFEPSAFNLCNRYGIRAVNGFLLEEYEDEAIKNLGSVKFGKIPREDRLLRTVKKRRAVLSKEKRRIAEIRKVVGQINDLRIQRIELPSYLLPFSEQDLEEKYVWLSELNRMPKITGEGIVQNIIVNVGTAPFVKGFRIIKEIKTDLSWIAIISIWIVSIWAILPSMELYALVFPVIASGLIYLYREKLVHKTSRIVNRKTSESSIGSEVIVIPDTSEQFEDSFGDYAFSDLIGLNSVLVDKNVIGVSTDFIVERYTWKIKGLQVTLKEELVSEIGDSKAIIPIHMAEFNLIHERKEIKIKALYVLGEYFLTERKRI